MGTVIQEKNQDHVEPSMISTILIIHRKGIRSVLRFGIETTRSNSWYKGEFFLSSTGFGTG